MSNDEITLADIEGQIERHQKSIRDLCEVAMRMDEAMKWPGAQAKRWLTDRGFIEPEAGRLIVRVVKERRERDAEGADSA